MHLVRCVRREGSRGLDGLARVTVRRPFDDVEIAFEDKAHRARHVAMVKTARARLELDEHVRSAGRHIDVEDPVIAAIGDEVLPFYVRRVEPELHGGSLWSCTLRHKSLLTS